MQLKLSFCIVQKLKFDGVLVAKLVITLGFTIETMDVDVKMVKQVFCC